MVRRASLSSAIVGLLLIGAAVSAAERREAKLPMQIPVLVINYFPVKGDLIDQKVTGDWVLRWRRPARKPTSLPKTSSPLLKMVHATTATRTRMPSPVLPTGW